MSGGGLAKNIARLGLGAAAGQAIAVGAGIIATPWFSPAALGALGVVSSLASPGAVLLGRRLDLGLPSYRSDDDANSIHAYLRRISGRGVVVSLVWAVASLMAFGLADSEFDGRAAVVGLAPLAVVTTLAFDTEAFGAARRKAFGQAATGRAVLGASQGFSLLLAGLVAPSAVTAALTYPLGRALAAWWLARRNGMREYVVDRSEAARKRYRAYPRVNVPSGLVSSVSIALPTLLFSSGYGLAVAGLFFLARRTVGLPLQLLSQAVAQAVYGEVGGQTADEIRATTAKAFRITSSIALLFLLFVTVVARSPLMELLPSEWEDVRFYLIPVALAGVGQLVSAPYGNVLLVIERHQLRFMTQLSRLMILLLSFGVAWALNAEAVTTAWVTSVASLASYGIIVAAAGSAIRKYDPQSIVKVGTK